MSFSAEWLALREPADHAARDAGLLGRAIGALPPDGVVVDLGAGTGSTGRAFDGHAEASCLWRLIDGDAELLGHATASRAGSQAVQMDLAHVAALPLEGASLVTASALLDLMPEAWVVALAERLSAARLPFYAALNYDGVMRWMPTRPEDAEIVAAFNAHQRTDKGTGMALGPLAATRTAAIFEARGYEVVLADSPWQLGPDQAALQRPLIEGIAQAAAEMGLDAAGDWGRRRLAGLAQTTTFIGHTDLLALPRRAH